MNPEDILNKAEGNFFFTPDTVSRIWLRKRKTYYDEDGGRQQNPHSLLIESRGKKYNFGFSSDVAYARNFLSQISGRV